MFDPAPGLKIVERLAESTAMLLVWMQQVSDEECPYCGTSDVHHDDCLIYEVASLVSDSLRQVERIRRWEESKN